MDATHIILGRPWQYDHDANYRGTANQYIMLVGDKQITLMSRPREKSHKSVEPNFLLQSRYEFSKTVQKEGSSLAIVLHTSRMKPT